MTTLRWADLSAAMIAILLGLWASLEFLLPGRTLANRRQIVTTLLGVSLLSNAGLSLYAFAQYEMQFSQHVWAFRIMRLLFAVTAGLLLVAVLLPTNKRAPSN